MNRRLAAFLLISVIVMIAAAAVAQNVDDPARAPSRARRALALTQKYRDAGDHERAAALLTETLAEHPEHDHHLLRLHLALSLRRLGRDEEALVHLNAAAAMEPRSRDVQLARAGAALATGAYAVAAESLELAWRLKPDEGPGLLHDALVARLLDDDEPAAVILAGEFLDVASTPTVEQLRAVVTAAIYAKDQPLVRRGAERCRSLHADDPEAWILISQARQADDDLTGAAAALQVSDWLRPLTPDHRLRLGDLLFAVGAPAMAASRYAEAMGDTLDAADAERLASARLAAHQGDEAAVVLQTAVSRTPTARLWALLGDCHLDRERYGEAATAYRASLALADDDDVAARLQHCEAMLP